MEMNMAGIRQHYIPQFLQKGFISHTENDNFFTWVFRKDRPPFNSNLRQVGLEKLFYTEDKDWTLDNIITEQEKVFSSTILDIRINNSINNYSSTELATLIAHFEVRTRHFRESFLNSAQYVSNKIIKCLENDEIFTNFIFQHFKKNPSLLRDALVKELQELSISKGDKDLICKSIIPHINVENLHKLVPNISLSSVLTSIKSLLVNGLVLTIKHGHIQALIQEDSRPEIKIDLYSKLNYSLIANEQINFPLGDSIVLFKMANTNSFKPLYQESDNIQAIILPISSNMLLLGSAENYCLDIENIPNEIVSCSLEYFICCEQTEKYINLSKNIGSNAELITKEEMNKLISQQLNI